MRHYLDIQKKSSLGLQVMFRILLSAVLVIGTGGFGAFGHYCKGELVSLSVVIPAETCGMPQNGEKDCTPPKEDGLHQHCCNDVVQFFQVLPHKEDVQISAGTLVLRNDWGAVQVPRIAYFAAAVETKVPPPAVPFYVRYENFRL